MLLSGVSILILRSRGALANRNEVAQQLAPSRCRRAAQDALEAVYDPQTVNICPLKPQHHFRPKKRVHSLYRCALRINRRAVRPWIRCPQSSEEKPDAFTAGPQRVISALTILVNSSVLSPLTSNASFSSPSIIALDLSAVRIAALSSSTRS